LPFRERESCLEGRGIRNKRRVKSLNNKKTKGDMKVKTDLPEASGGKE